MTSAPERLVGRPSLADLPPPPPGRRGWPWTTASTPLPPARPDGSPWPRVSIVTPSFNQGAFIEATIRSVLLQGYPNLEYVVRDGGSTDATRATLARYEPWLTACASEPDGGQSDAINLGFAATTGAIIGWLNSDDCFAPDALGTVATAFAGCGPEVGAVVGTGSKIDAAGQVFYSLPPQAVTRESLLDWCSGRNFLQPACLFTRTAWEAAGPLRLDLDYCMDLALWLRLAERYRFVVVPETLALVRTHDDAKTIRDRHKMFAEIALLLATDGGAWDKGKALLFAVMEADDTQKRGVKHLSQALGREVLRRLRALTTRGT
jgi:glycosyltransferase involved in cell wall biosynthesis